jgi:hypothetical protein
LAARYFDTWRIRLRSRVMHEIIVSGGMVRGFGLDGSGSDYES